MCNIRVWEWVDLIEVRPTTQFRDRRVKDRSPRKSQAQGICLWLGSVLWTSEFSRVLLCSILHLFWEFHRGWGHFSSPHWNVWKPELKWGPGIPAPKGESSHPSPLEEIGYIYMIIQTFSLIWKIEDILFDHWLLAGGWKGKSCFDFK